MTDKELFKKAEKIFNLNENIVEKCYKNGQFNKILIENIGSSARTSKQVGSGRGGRRGGGLLGGLGSIARGIGNVAASPFKLAGAVGKGYRQAQSEKARMQRAKAEANRAREIAKQEKIKTKIAKRGLKQNPAANNYVNSSTLLTPSTSKTTSKNNLSKRDNILNNVKAGDTIALTLAKDQDNVARIVKIISVSDDEITVNDTRKKSSSNYTINKGNIKDVDYFRK